VTTTCTARQTDAVGAALDCELPADHEGAHEAHTTPDVTVTWTGGSPPNTDPQAARARRRHTIRWMLNLASLTPAGHADLRTAIEAEQADADEAYARLADYENRLSWETTCGEHARLLDACRAADERAEKAEAELRGVRNGGLYRQIRRVANSELPEGSSNADRELRDFARSLERWIPEGCGWGRQPGPAALDGTGDSDGANLGALTAPIGPREPRPTSPDHPVHDLWEALTRPTPYGPEEATGLIRAYYDAITSDPPETASPCRRDDQHAPHDFEVWGRVFRCPGTEDAAPAEPVPECGGCVACRPPVEPQPEPRPLVINIELNDTELAAAIRRAVQRHPGSPS
jgi:hypothetical protein